MTHAAAHGPSTPGLDTLDTTSDLAAAVAALQIPSGHQSPMRRRPRSVSPQRRSPKLRHTNGRLDAAPASADVDSDVVSLDGESNQIERALLEVSREAVHAHKSTGSIPSARSSRQRRESASFLVPARNGVRRSISCAGCEASSTETEEATPPRRFKILYRDEALRESYAKNTRRMIEQAKAVLPSPEHASGDGNGTTAVSNQQQFALKALRYRKLLGRMDEIDASRLNDPTYDVLECLGVHWCKAKSEE